ncbi:unnamed protein product [Plutella xylostella]|uniref:(diamondback moth) hypothetical protein n=1 Tax=Plutella xylostella TaxID=51655 RepID=A0A8S4FLE8_PLUXY|nr:unnamed protein product [Plutella xylostella]
MYESQVALLENEELLQTLQTSRRTALEATQQLSTSRQTEAEIDDARQVPLLENEELLQTLQTSRRTALEATQQLSTSRQTEAEIDEARQVCGGAKDVRLEPIPIEGHTEMTEEEEANQKAQNVQKRHDSTQTEKVVARW